MIDPSKDERNKKRDKHRYVKVTVDGSSVICLPAEVDDMIGDEPASAKREDVWMTADEYEALPEFQGF